MPTGPGRHLYKLLAYRNRQAIDARVFAFDQCDPSMMLPLERDFGVRWQTVGKRFTHPLTYVRGLPRLLNEIDEFAPHIIQTHHTVIVDWAARLATKMRGVPLNLSRAVSKPKDYHRTRGGVLAWWFHHLGDSLTGGIVDYYLPNSLDVSQYLKEVERISDSKLLLIPNGVDTDYFAESEGLRQQGREFLGLSEQDQLILNVGPLKPLKRQNLLIEAALQLMPQFPHLKVALVGRTWGAEDELYLGKIREAIERAGQSDKFSFTGELSDVRGVLAAADIYAHPSIVEGSSNAVLEAMSMGRACLVSDIPSCQELIVDNETGLVVARDDVQVLSQALGSLLAETERRKQIGAAARRRAIEHFSVKRMCTDLEAIYRRALNEKGVKFHEDSADTR
jgi:glycosyltransferase involved in cell wall biosynthesis